MKKAVTIILFFVISAFVLPISVFFIMNLQDNPEQKRNSEKSMQTHEISVFFADENNTRTMNLDEYLCGVVAAEMPASFETEALKAQAVAARSYAIYKKNNPGNEHPDAAVCTDFAHCKAYKSHHRMQQEWGGEFAKYFNKINGAVTATSGEILTYDGEVALAVFHSQSGSGRTENSSDVWGGNVPYLVSVESHGEENAPNFYSTAVFSFEEFTKKINDEFPDIKIKSSDEIGEIEKSEGGSVKNITIAGVKISGKDIRKIFGLRSSCFKVIAEQESVKFEVSGYGHGVGMSQYGANTMAKEGYNYKQILTHYYSGTQIEGV